jgi:nitrite reductase (NO-forming)
MGKKNFAIILVICLTIISIFLIINSAVNKKVEVKAEPNAASHVQEQQKGVSQKPVPIKIDRIGAHEVKVEMTAQITNIEINKGETYHAWTFNGQAPGPVLVVNQGDTIHFTLKNMDPSMPHSMDFHAVHASPSKDFVDVMPNKSGSFTYTAENSGVFMYHCGTNPVLMHIANGMNGMIIVKPATGYPTDSDVDREYVVIQNEWYKQNNFKDMENNEPKYVVFSTKALKDGDLNTNGTVGALVDHPLLAKVGDRVRFYLLNIGPNETTSFHVVGTQFDDVYLDGNPYNHLKGMQTVLLPASGGAVVEFTVNKEGSYPFVNHQSNGAAKGASGVLKVTKDGNDDGSMVMAH